MKNITVCALIISVVAFCVDAEALPTHMRTYSYYGFDYNQPDENYCHCQIGPCPQYGFLMGQKTYACNGQVYSWGVTQGSCFTKIEVETSECPGAASAEDVVDEITPVDDSVD